MDSNKFSESLLTSSVRRAIWSAAALVLPGLALSAPTGGQVVAGSAAIAQAGTKTTITQSTAKGAINWQSFSIGTNEYVQFVQPGSTSVTLNRVVGNDPSQLLGQMSANGQIFLVNPSGVYFGANARIDVAGLVATTFDIADDDFMAGRYQFARVEGRDPAQVINDGTITANGGYVVLAGDGVQNHGLIEAYLGDIVMAAGERVGLDLGGDGLISFSVDGEALTEIAGVENTGELYADGGRVFLTAKVQGDLLSTAVNHEGLIQARTVEERDGIVYLGGSGGDVMIAGTIDADADTANSDGGTILVVSTDDITVSDGALVTAQGDGSGDGGMVRVIAHEVLDVEVDATVTTEGGSTGQGGFIEVSGHTGLSLHGDVKAGAGGEVLIDPTTLVIAGGSTGGTGSAIVYENSIETMLGNGTDVTLIATDLITVQNVAGNFSSGGTGSNQVIFSRGSGDLTMAIGFASASGASFTLGDIGPGSTCSTVGLCMPGNKYQFYPDSGGSIRMRDGSFNYVGIDIFGDLTMSAGTRIGVIDIDNARANNVTINGDLRHFVNDSLNPARLFISAWTGAVNLNGDTRVQNGFGDVRINVNGDVININGDVNAFAGNGGSANIAFNAGSSGTINWNGGNIIAADNINLGSTCSYGGCFSVASGFDSLGNSVSGLSMAPLTPGSGEALISLVGQTINLSAPFQASASAILGVTGFLGAIGGVNARVDVTAFGGDINLGSSLAPGALVMAKTGRSGTSNGAARVRFMNGQKLDIWGAKTPIIEGSDAIYYTVLAETDGGRISQIVLDANADIAINTSAGEPAPVIASWTDGKGASTATTAQIDLTAGRSGTVPVTGNVKIEGVLEALATGAVQRDNANVSVQIQSDTGDILVAPGAFIHAKAGDFTSPSPANLTAYSDIYLSTLRTTDGLITVEGDLWTETRAQQINMASVSLRGKATYIGSAASLYAHGSGESAVAVSAAGGHANMQVFGDMIAIGGQEADVYVSGSAGVTIGSSANLLASGQAPAATAYLSVWGGGDVMVDGDLLAIAGLGGSGTATVELLTSSSAGVSLGTSGKMEARGLRANVKILASNSTGAAGLVSIDGDISAIAVGTSTIHIMNNGAGGVRLRGSLLADASGGASIQLFTRGGSMDVGGSALATANNFAGLNITTFIDANKMIVDGSLTADGVNNSNLYLFHQGSDFSIGPSAVIESKTATGSLATMQIASGATTTIQDGALISAGSTIDIHVNSLTVNGVVEASRSGGPTSISIDGVGLFSVGSTGLIEALTSSGSANISIGGSNAFTSVNVEGTIRASGESFVQASIQADDIFLASSGQLIASASSVGSDVSLLGTGGGSITALGLIQANNLNATALGGNIDIANATVNLTHLNNLGTGDIKLTAPGTLTVERAITTAGDISLNVAGDLNLTSQMTAGSGGSLTISAGTAVRATQASIVDAGSLTVLAGTTIDLSLASLTLHNGTPSLVSSQFGDAQALSDFSLLGAAVPTSSIANAAFIAPNGLTLGAVDFFGDYMYLKSDTLTLNQAIGTWLPGTEPTPGSVNPNVIVQMQPFTAGQPVLVEDVMPSPVPGTTYYTNLDHFQKFPGTSLFVGDSLYTGGIGIGQNGLVNIGGQNFLAATTGPVAGIGNIVSTGIVGALGMSPPPPTSPPPSSPPPTDPINTGAVNTVVQQTTTPTDPAGSSIPEETVQANVPPEDETGTEPTPDEPPDIIAMLEQQPLIDGQVEVNNTVLTCQ